MVQTSLIIADSVDPQLPIVVPVPIYFIEVNGWGIKERRAIPPQACPAPAIEAGAAVRAPQSTLGGIALIATFR
jgi:hypothetical protein